MGPQAEGGAHVVVTLDSIYSLALQTRDDVRDIKNKLNDLTDDSEDHEARIRSLERKVYYAAGVAAAVGYAASQWLPMVTR